MVADMVADMEADMVADIKLNKVIDMVADQQKIIGVGHLDMVTDMEAQTFSTRSLSGLRIF